MQVWQGPVAADEPPNACWFQSQARLGLVPALLGSQGGFFPLLWVPVSLSVKWASTFSRGVRTETVCDVEHVPGSATGVLALQEYALSLAFSPASCLLHAFPQGSGETWQQRGLVAESLPNDIDLTGS